MPVGAANAGGSNYQFQIFDCPCTTSIRDRDRAVLSEDCDKLSFDTTPAKNNLVHVQRTTLYMCKEQSWSELHWLWGRHMRRHANGRQAHVQTGIWVADMCATSRWVGGPNRLRGCTDTECRYHRTTLCPVNYPEASTSQISTKIQQIGTRHWYTKKCQFQHSECEQHLLPSTSTPCTRNSSQYLHNSISHSHNTFTTALAAKLGWN